jgi:hypothetical protein
MAALDDVVCPVKMSVRAVTPDFFDDLGNQCDRKGGTLHGLGDLARIIPSSSCGAGRGGGAH